MPWELKFRLFGYSQFLNNLSFIITIFYENFTTLKKDVRKIYPQSLPLTVADNSENEQLRNVNEEQSKKITNFQREITILEEKLKEKDAELQKRKTELSHLRQGSKINI